jgi:hypothetical protein
MARRAHNPKVAGSNPAPATKKALGIPTFSRVFSRLRCFWKRRWSASGPHWARRLRVLVRFMMVTVVRVGVFQVRCGAEVGGLDRALTSWSWLGVRLALLSSSVSAVRRDSARRGRRGGG